MKTPPITFIYYLSFGCSNSGFNNNNPYLPNYTFTIDILELARLLNLQYPSNASIMQVKVGFMFSTPEVATMLLKLPVPAETLSACSI
jgi:hypothetical protein